MQKLKKPVSIILSMLMVLSVFAVVPFTASAAVGEFVPESKYLTFTAEEDNSWVKLSYQEIYNGGTFKYNKNNSGWEDYTNEAQIDLEKGDSVRFRGKAPMYGGQMFGQYKHFFIGGKVACSGNVMSLRLDDNGMSQGLSYGCFNYLFYGCTGLTAAPELPEKTLAAYCYDFMFYGCTNLTSAPALPATTLEPYCYENMFSASGLTTAPELPATKLAYNCYSAMFSSCTSLTTAPELPATTLASYCYFAMFNGCTSLTTAPELPATTLASYCYENMFSASGLTTAPALPATTLSSSCYENMFYGCSKIKLSKTQTAEYSIPYSVPSGGNGTTPAPSNALNNMFAGTGGTFTGTPEINTTYYMYVPKLFPGHSVSLGGDIGVNFFIDPAAAGADEKATVSVEFSWNGQTRTVVAEYDEGKKLFKAVCDVVAAEVACDITAVATVNNAKQAETDTYSVQDYAEAVYKNPTEYDSEKSTQLQTLAQALLNYGAMAQTVFVENMKKPVKDPAAIVSTVGNNGYEAVTADKIGAAIKDTSADLNAIATDLGAKYYTSSLIYLSKNTLRLYFTPTTYPGTIPNADKYTGNISKYYYYVDHANIPAAELDEQQELKVGDYTFTYTALDYAKAVVESTKMGREQQNLAKSLYLYNQAANKYFDDAPAQNIVDLSKITEDTTVEDGYTITGTLQKDCKISIADGARVTLQNVNITNLRKNCDWAGINCTGDATLVLKGENNKVCAGLDGVGSNHYPGIWIAPGKTLTIEGDGSLTAYGNDVNSSAAGIGGGSKIEAGNIVINGGNITATGGFYSAGIGSGIQSKCGTITIKSGKIKATGGLNAAGIGSGYNNSSCGDITINGGEIEAYGDQSAAGIGSGGSSSSSCGKITIDGGDVTAYGGNLAPGIGSGATKSSCGDITINGGTVTATGGIRASGIGSGSNQASCGKITINGGEVTASGGEYAPGIGSGFNNSSCGNITISANVTSVKATKGKNAPNSIGAGARSSCDGVTIGGKEYPDGITDSPYTYKPQP